MQHNSSGPILCILTIDYGTFDDATWYLGNLEVVVAEDPDVLEWFHEESDCFSDMWMFASHVEDGYVGQQLCVKEDIRPGDVYAVFTEWHWTLTSSWTGDDFDSYPDFVYPLDQDHILIRRTMNDEQWAEFQAKENLQNDNSLHHDHGRKRAEDRQQDEKGHAR